MSISCETPTPSLVSHPASRPKQENAPQLVTSCGALSLLVEARCGSTGLCFEALLKRLLMDAVLQRHLFCYASALHEIEQALIHRAHALGTAEADGAVPADASSPRE